MLRRTSLLHCSRGAVAYQVYQYPAAASMRCQLLHLLQRPQFIERLTHIDILQCHALQRLALICTRHVQLVSCVASC